VTPDEGSRWRAHQGRNGDAAGQTGTNGTLNTQEQGRPNTLVHRSNQDVYGQRPNGVQTGGAQSGPTAQIQPMGPARSMPQWGQGGQPRAAMQPQAPMQSRTAMQPQATMQSRSAMQPRATMAPRTAMQPRSATPARAPSQPRQARPL
jgi:hypothetical protein